MPLQKIETIDEPRSRAEAQGKLFDSTKYHTDDFRNMLIWGDNKLVMSSLLRDYKGKIDLVYIDPPFDVGADFTLSIPVGDRNETLDKDQSALEMVAYRDTWGKGTDSYLHMIYERLILMKDLLSETGSICVHCDWHASHYLKKLLIEIFGNDNFRNEIVWWYYNKMQGNVGRFAANHDTILWFSKTSTFKYFSIREPREEPKRQQKRVWDAATQSLKQAKDEEGKLIYYTETERTIDDVWRIPYLMPADQTENLGYNTQKPVELVGRFIDTLSGEGDTVLDAFCGSGTTLAAAEGLRAHRINGKKVFYFAAARRWIGVDLSRFAVHTTRKRQIELQRQLHIGGKPYRAFDVYNLGRYERQWWHRENLNGADEEHRKVVLGFYKAEVLNSFASPLLHGRKGSALVHVDSIDSVFSRTELRDVAKAAKEAGAKQVNCLAWEFEMDLRLEAHSLQAELGIEIHLLRIPREIMEKNRKEITFFEVATLEAEPVYKKNGEAKSVVIKLKRFLPSLAEVPEKELEALEEKAIKHGFDFIDFWAVDFDYRDGQPFKHHWQAYRTRKNRSLPTISDQEFSYEKPGRYTVCVKVVDTFGCDTSITVPIEV